MPPKSQRVCFGCTKPVTDAVHCSDCNSDFHPSCLRRQANKPGCLRCCRDLARQYAQPDSQPDLQSAFAAASALDPPPSSQFVPAANLSPHPPSAPAPASVMLQEMMRRMDARFDDLDRRFDALPAMQEHISGNTHRIEHLERQNLALSEGMKDLRTAFAEHQRSQVASQQELRRASARLCETEIIISGVPCASSSGTPAAVQQVASALGLELTDDDVTASRFLVSRSGPRRNRIDAPLPIIARLRLPELSRSLLAAKKTKGLLRTTDLDPPPSGPPLVIHINESLPGNVHKLLVAARASARARGYKYTWHSGGVILLKRGDGESTRRLYSTEDLAAFEAEVPVDLPPVDLPPDDASDLLDLFDGSRTASGRGAAAARLRGSSRGASRGGTSPDPFAPSGSRTSSTTTSTSTTTSRPVSPLGPTLPRSAQQC